jgi:hypothetical protein
MDSEFRVSEFNKLTVLYSEATQSTAVESSDG